MRTMSECELLLVLRTHKVQNRINCLMDLAFVLRLFSCIMRGGGEGGRCRCIYCTWTVASLNRAVGAGLSVSIGPLFSSLLACLASPYSTRARQTPTQGSHAHSMRVSR